MPTRTRDQRPRRHVEDDLERGYLSPWLGLGPSRNRRERSIDQMKRDMYNPFSGTHTKRLASGGRLRFDDGGAFTQAEMDQYNRENPRNVVDPEVAADRKLQTWKENTPVYPGRTYDADVMGGQTIPLPRQDLNDWWKQQGYYPSSPYHRGVYSLPERNAWANGYVRPRDNGYEIVHEYMSNPRAKMDFAPFGFTPFDSYHSGTKVWTDKTGRKIVVGQDGRMIYSEPYGSIEYTAKGKQTRRYDKGGTIKSGDELYAPDQGAAAQPYNLPPDADFSGPFESVSGAIPARKESYPRWTASGPRPPMPGESLKDYMFINPLTKALQRVTPDYRDTRGSSEPPRVAMDQGTGQALRGDDTPSTEGRARNAANAIYNVATFPVTRWGMLAGLPGQLEDIGRSISNNDWGDVAQTAGGIALGVGARSAINRFRPPEGKLADLSNQLFGGTSPRNPISPTPGIAPVSGLLGFGSRNDPMWPRTTLDLSDRTYQLKWPGELTGKPDSVLKQAGDWLTSHAPNKWLPRQTLDIVKYEGSKATPIGTVTLGRGLNSSIVIDSLRLNDPKGKVSDEMIKDITDAAGNTFRWRHKMVGTSVETNPKTGARVQFPDKLYNEPSPIRSAPAPTMSAPSPSAAGAPMSRTAPPMPPPGDAGNDEAWRKAISIYGGEAYIPPRIRQLLGHYSGGRIGYQDGGATRPPDWSNVRRSWGNALSQTGDALYGEGQYFLNRPGVQQFLSEAPGYPDRSKFPPMTAGEIGQRWMGTARDIGQAVRKRYGYADGGTPQTEPYRTLRPLRRSRFAALPMSNNIEDRRYEPIKIQDRLPQGDPMNYRGYKDGGRVMPKAFWQD